MGATLSRMLSAITVKKASEESPMSRLPNELLVQILDNVSIADLNASRLANRRMCYAANEVRKNRDKPRYTASLCFDNEDDQLKIGLEKRWKSGSRSEPIDTFDLSTFELIEVALLEISNINEKNAERILNYVNELLEITGAFSSIEELRLTNVTVPNSSAGKLSHLFKIVVPQCKSQLRTFKWTDSVAVNGEEEMSEEIVRSMIDQLPGSYMNVELMQARITTVVDLFEAWMRMNKPTLFALVLLDRKKEWQESLLEECQRRGYTHFAHEYEHPLHVCAHMKVNMSTDTVRLFPVLDVPAKTQNMPHVQARWFRDFH